MDQAQAQLVTNLALILAAQGMRAYADFADRASKGQVTMADCELAASQLGANIQALQDEIKAARAG